MSCEQKIALSVGGTFGHIGPALQMAKKLKDRSILIGIGLNQSMFLKDCPFAKLSLDGKRSIYSLIKATLKSIFLLLENRIKTVVCFGSYHSLPATLAALILGKKIWVFEPNSSFGKVNRLFLPFADKVIFSDSKLQKKHPKKSVLLNQIFTKKDPLICFKRFHLSSNKPILLIIGGSSGSKFLNELVVQQLQNLTDFSFIHLCGLHTDPITIKNEYEKHQLEAYVAPFIEDIGDAMQISSVAITRAGASTLKELKAYDLPSLIFPFEGAYQHQLENAHRFLEDQGQGKIFSQDLSIDLNQQLRTLMVEKKPLKQHVHQGLTWEDIILSV